MKKTIIIVVILVLVLAGTLFLIRGSEDKGICVNCGEESEIVVSNPQANQFIQTPLEIEGKARGTWFFEASFPAELIDKDGKTLGIGIMQAQNDWMTENFVEFKGEIEFTSDETGPGKLILRKDNPSGLPENDKSFEVPVQIPRTETMTIKAYFNNNQMDPEFSCNKVFAVERIISRTEAVARAALEELLKGSTQAEQNQGFFTSINPGVKIQSLVIENNIAKVDFDEQMEFQVGGSCRVSAIRAQITQTLKQFSTVGEVIISINGRTEDILQP